LAKEYKQPTAESPPLFSKQKQANECKEPKAESLPLFSRQKPCKSDVRPMVESPPLFSKQKDGTCLTSPGQVAPAAFASAKTNTPRLVKGTFIQDSQGRFTPAPGYEPPVDVQIIFGRSYAEDIAEATKSIFGPMSTNKASSGYNGLFGGAKSEFGGGGLFGDRPLGPSSLFGPPAPEITSPSLFEGPGAIPNELLPGGSDGRKIFGTPQGSGGNIGGIFGGQPWPSNTSNPPPSNLFGGSTTGKFSIVEAGGTGNHFAAKLGSSGNVSVSESGGS
jgi:hypothetical protein